MIFTLPPLLADMLAAHNAQDTAAFIACFAADAVVRHDGNTYVGLPAVRTWFEDASQRYRAVFHVTELTTQDGEPVLWGKVSGNFASGVFSARYNLALEDGKIVALKIARA